jgi:NADH-quinone oxidoreductase subunit F
MEKMLDRFEHGEGRTEDIDLLWDMQRKHRGQHHLSASAMPRHGPWPPPSATSATNSSTTCVSRQKVKDPKHFAKEPMKRVERSYAG